MTSNPSPDMAAGFLYPRPVQEPDCCDPQVPQVLQALRGLITDMIPAGRRLVAFHHGAGWMPKRSAGLLLFRRLEGELALLLAHPGGPFWARRDLGAWSIPKGEYQPGEDPLAAALREFEEETGMRPPGEPISLGDAVQPSRKIVSAWAVSGDFDPAQLRSNFCEIEWPPRSGRRIAVPEIDRVAWFSAGEPWRRILPGQRIFIDRLLAHLGLHPSENGDTSEA